VLGTVGLAIAWPRTTVEAWSCSSSRVEGAYSDLATLVLERLGLSNVCVRVAEAVPRGVGLGGTTALTLSTAVASLAVSGRRLTRDEVIRVAVKLGRGKWSGLGVYSFLHGGFIVDGGYSGGDVPPLVARHDIPRAWRVVVILLEDFADEIRRLKQAEDRILARLPRAPSEFSSRLARLILAGALPCLLEARCRCFIKALWEYNHVLGEYWAKVGQKGVYCCSEAEELVEEAKNHGFYLIQSSWGPSLWTITEGVEEAERLSRIVKDWARRRGVKVTLWITVADNYGAVAWPGDVMEWRS
jgi:beta-ribofuranosylaminobenzene 5'-phosphate synthase